MLSLGEGSFGYGLVRSLVQQTGGKIEVRNGTGLVVTISFLRRHNTPRNCDIRFMEPDRIAIQYIRKTLFPVATLLL